MFESLTTQKREPRRIAQPMLSFALHAGLIAFAVGQTTDPGIEIVDPVPQDVIYIPARPESPRQVPPATDLPVVPGPIACQCNVPVPGPIPPRIPEIGREAIPGLPVSNPIGTPGQFLDPGPPGVPGVYTEADLTDSPRLVHFPEPVYPPALKGAGVEGQVQVIYVVDSLGAVERGSITIVSSDHPLMTEAVRRSLPGAGYLPGKVRGKSVRTLVRQTIRFSLMSL